MPPDHPLAHELHVRSPRAWDVEHPNLYRMKVAVFAGGQVIETVERSLGFRTVNCRGNQLFVNAQPVKLHGVCRHSIHPLYGRAVPADSIRGTWCSFAKRTSTSCAPLTTLRRKPFWTRAIAMGSTLRKKQLSCWSTASSANPELKEQFLRQLREMISRDRHHPCVLFWSLGNESSWGPNIAAEAEIARHLDPSRPTIFSYPDTTPMATNGFDIYSKHYADVDSSLDSPLYPLLNDEFAHVSCYNLDTLRRDPGVRNFWGESIKRFGEKFLTDDGCLGGCDLGGD